MPHITQASVNSSLYFESFSKHLGGFVDWRISCLTKNLEAGSILGSAIISNDITLPGRLSQWQCVSGITSRSNKGGRSELLASLHAVGSLPCFFCYNTQTSLLILYYHLNSFLSVLSRSMPFQPLAESSLFCFEIRVLLQNIIVEQKRI